MTPVTLTVDPKGYFLYWTDQNKVRLHRLQAGQPASSPPETLSAFLTLSQPEKLKQRDAAPRLWASRRENGALITFETSNHQLPPPPPRGSRARRDE